MGSDILKKNGETDNDLLESDLASKLRHEINNPLTVILGNLELIKKAEQAGMVDLEHIRASLNKIEIHSNRINQVLLELEKIVFQK